MALTKVGKEGVTGISNSSNATAITIDSSENVGIGKSPVSAMLDVNGNVKAGNGTASAPSYSFQGSSAIGMFTPDSGFSVAFGTGGSERMRIDSSGRVTMPSQPAFQAVPASSQDNIATGTDVTIIFGTERFDIGSNFASNTFTAPVTGKYYLNAQLRVQQIDTGANYYQLKISTSNHNYVMTLDPNFSADLLYGPMSISIVADMDASDTATVKIHQSGGSQQTDINTESYFSGYLLG